MNIISRYFYGLITFILLVNCAKEEAVPVDINFEFEVFNNDFSVPVEVIIFNNTRGADSYEWAFEAGSPAISSQRNPGVIIFNTKGTHKISLKATNEDGSEAFLEKVLNIDDPVAINFTVTPEIDTFSPIKAQIENLTTGATSYQWTFQDGVPSTSTSEQPPVIVFSTPGEHKITLEATNGRETETFEQRIEVAPFLEADFEYEVNFEDDDFQAPVTVAIKNNSISATSYEWEFTNATPLNSDEAEPNVTFNTAGTQELKLTASNGKETKSITKTIEIVTDTNLRVLKNVNLGVNAAHTSNSIGSFYDLDTRSVFYANELTPENSSSIDLVYFGLNENFTRNVFVSPDNLENTTFPNLQDASKTKIINSLENCMCGVSLSVNEFDTMTTDAMLRATTITETPEGSLAFTNAITPRIIVFETADGRKGALKIKQFVANGKDSFIDVDIKVQKIAR